MKLPRRIFLHLVAGAATMPRPLSAISSKLRPTARRDGLLRSAAAVTLTALLAFGAARSAPAQTLTAQQQLALDIFKELVEINTVTATGDTRRAADAMAARLRAGGFDAADVQVFKPAPRKGNLVARLRGTGARKPILLLAHLDVVEALPADWSFDPFKLTEKDGYYYGRGSADDKYMAATFVANLIRYKQEGFRPDRDIIVALETDEEILDRDAVGIPRRTRKNILKRLCDAHGDKPVKSIERKHVQAMVDAKAATPSAARNLLAVLRLLMAFAIKAGIREDDPTVGVKHAKIRTAGYDTWSEEDIAAFEARHPIGSKARLALALLLYTGQRRGDVVKMGRQHVRGNKISVKQNKTGAVLMLPMVDELRAAIEATPTDHLTFLTTHFGQPYTAAGFTNWFRDRCNEAGLRKGLSAHGLRKAMCRRLAERGCSINMIAANSNANEPLGQCI
jgi:integrase